MGEVELSVVVVSYNSRAYLPACLGSLLPQVRALRGEVIVVDNASTDGSPEVVRQFSGVRLVESAVNVGFVRAVNQALKLAQGRFILILNPDTEVRPGAVGTLVRFMAEHPRVGLAGPKLLYPDGTVQPSRRRFPGLAVLLTEGTFIQWHFPGLGIFRRFYCQDLPADIPQPVDWVTGACMLVRREAVEQVGPMDERFFMYSEELDWCRRLWSAGWQVYYVPGAEVVHQEAASSRQDPVRQRVNFYASRWKYAAKYYGPVVGVLLRGFLLFGLGVELLEEAIKLALGHKPQLRRGRIRVLAGVIRSGLR